MPLNVIIVEDLYQKLHKFLAYRKSDIDTMYKVPTFICVNFSQFTSDKLVREDYVRDKALSRPVLLLQQHNNCFALRNIHDEEALANLTKIFFCLQ